ncbi:hypothetical protein [Paeniglutamicibacter antarcticus]|uniref:SdpI family protein n=1 Tax=Paeniglutamicibacter antarcticus TaxID=494023 RepID=A0ABP9TLV5_9MICC
MDSERLSELIMLGFMILLMAAMAAMMKAAASGQVKRNASIGLRTAALRHCESCWLLGHHAALNKSIMGFGIAAVVLAVGGVATVLLEPSGFFFPATVMLGTLLMLAGVFLGLRDANRAVAKVHAGERIVSS